MKKRNQLIFMVKLPTMNESLKTITPFNSIDEIKNKLAQVLETILDNIVVEDKNQTIHGLVWEEVRHIRVNGEIIGLCAIVPGVTEIQASE